MRKKIASVVLAFVMLFGTVGVVGCRHKVAVNEPPQVVLDRSLLAAADALDLVATGLIAVNETAKNLLGNGQIDKETYDKIHAWLVKIASADKSAAEAVSLAEAGNDTNWRVAIINVAEVANSVNPADFYIKDPNAQATFKTALATLNAAVKLIFSSYGVK